jgi:hypothetical protein
VFIEFMWQEGYPGAVEAAQRLEARLVEEFGAGAVPHDGKVFWESFVLRNGDDPHST